MNDLNLVLKFQLAGEPHFQIREAARIKVDGRGSLIFYDVQSGLTESLEVSRLLSFRLLTVRQNEFAQSALELPN